MKNLPLDQLPLLLRKQYALPAIETHDSCMLNKKSSVKSSGTVTILTATGILATWLCDWINQALHEYQIRH